MEQQKVQHMDRRAAVLAAFDSICDESQGDALDILQAMAMSSPRRAKMSLRLIAVNGGNGSDEGFN